MMRVRISKGRTIEARAPFFPVPFKAKRNCAPGSQQQQMASVARCAVDQGRRLGNPWN